MKDVEQLALILMKTFYLNIKDGIWIYVHTVMFFDIFGEPDLILVLDIHKLLFCPGVLCVGGQLIQLCQIFGPIFSVTQSASNGFP